MGYFHAPLVALTLAFALSAAHAQPAAFDVICKDGTSVPGSADRTACAGHGGAHTIVPARSNPVPRSSSSASSSTANPPPPR